MDAVIYSKIEEAKQEIIQKIENTYGISLDDIAMKNFEGDIVLPTATEIKNYTFAATTITDIIAPHVTSLKNGALQYCHNITELIDDNFPELTSIGDDGIRNCQNLGLIHLPKVTTLGTRACWQVNYNHAKTGYIVFPALESIGDSAFRQVCADVIDLGPNFHAIPYDGLYDIGARVNAVILRSPTLVTANNRDSVGSIKTLYVPSALVSDYATASNWVTTAGSRTVLAIEGTDYETHYADGTLIPTT